MHRSNLLPADELALIRTDIARLERREAALRAGFLAGELPVNGLATRVELRQQYRRSFLRDRLDERILADPRMWQDKVVIAVTVVQVGPAAGGRP